MNDKTTESNGDTLQTAAMFTLTEHANEIFSGSYANVDQIFRLTDKEKSSPEIAELAEAIGLISVKVEAREFALEQTIEELYRHQAYLEKSNQIRLHLTSIFINIVLLITVYTFVLGFLNSNLTIVSEMMPQIRKWASRIIELSALLLVIRMIVMSKLPLQSFGLTLANWKKAVVESLLVTGVVISFLVAVKTAVNIYFPSCFAEKQLFELTYFDFSYLTYILVAPLQEFIARGTVQGTLQHLFVGKYNNFMAILVTSFLFGSLHVYSSINFAIAALLTGLLWGWMYNRHRSLIGVSLSHFFIGNAAGLMGYWRLF